MSGIRRTFKYLKNYTWPLVGALVSLLIVNASNLFAPQLLRILIDEGITAMEMQIVWYVALGLVVVALARGLFNFFQGYLTEVTSQGVAYELRNDIFKRLQSLSFSYHDQAQTGKLMTRMTSDVEIIRGFTGAGLLQLLSALILLIGTLIILFTMNVPLTLIFLAMIPAIGVVFAIFVRQIMPLSKAVQEKLSNINTVLQENLAGIRLVKAFAREEYETRRFSNRNIELFDKNIEFVKLFSTFFPIVFFIANLSTVGVLWVGGVQVIRETLSLGELVAFIGYQGFFLMPIFMLGFIGTALSRAEVSAERVFEILDADIVVEDKPNAVSLDKVNGSIKFENVSFGYFGKEQPVLKEISFEVKPNQTVAILGKTGSGKSSIINLIPRFYDVSEGRILIDGIDVRDIKLESLRKHIGIVLQETTLFSGTLRENIAYGRPEAGINEIEDAAKAAQAYEFISELENGYDSLIGERGVGLSGGQKQRIAIARALILDPQILIMDDSTSSVDAETEYKIQQALETLKENRTTFIIAQRVSTVRNADLILLIDNGKLAAKGTHEELLECCEMYADILASQFGERTNQFEVGEEVSQ